jgi:hypothetical protein
MKEEANGLRVILIDPFKEKIRVAYPTLNDYMECIKVWMGVDLIDIVTLDENNMLIVDDNGLCYTSNRYFKWNPTNYPYAGKAVIVGYDDNGATTDASYHPKRVEDELVSWIPEGFSMEPRMEFISL